MPFAKVGDIKTHSSVCLSVCHKNFNLAHIFWSINDYALIFGMHDPCDKPFLLIPCGDLDLLHTSRSNMFPGRGITIFRISMMYLMFMLELLSDGPSVLPGMWTWGGTLRDVTEWPAWYPWGERSGGVSLNCTGRSCFCKYGHQKFTLNMSNIKELLDMIHM